MFQNVKGMYRMIIIVIILIVVAIVVVIAIEEYSEQVHQIKR